MIPLNKFKQFSFAILHLIRFEQSILAPVITALAAFLAGAIWQDILWISAAAWCLAVFGYSLDFFANKEIDKLEYRAKRRRNPIAKNKIPPYIGLVFSIIMLAASSIILKLTNWLVVIPWFLLVITILGLAFRMFEGPFIRSFRLGLLPYLYFFMGVATGTITMTGVIFANMFFFSLFGLKGFTDIRDFYLDQDIQVYSYPKKIGVRKTIYLSIVSLLISYILSLVVYWAGELSRIYLYLEIFYLVSGLLLISWSLYKVSKETIHKFAIFLLVGQSVLICIAILLGKLVLI